MCVTGRSELVPAGRALDGESLTAPAAALASGFSDSGHRSLARCLTVSEDVLAGLAKQCLLLMQAHTLQLGTIVNTNTMESFAAFERAAARKEVP